MASSARIDELRKKFDENPRRYFAPLANEYRKAGEIEQAIAICREHLPQQPGHMSGHIVFGQALYEARQLEEASSVFETALTLDPENLIALRHLGDIALILGDADAARGWYRRVLEADPRNEEIQAQLATLDKAASEAPTPAIGPPAQPPEPASALPAVAPPPRAPSSSAPTVVMSAVQRPGTPQTPQQPPPAAAQEESVPKQPVTAVSPTAEIVLEDLVPNAPAPPVAPPESAIPTVEIETTSFEPPPPQGSPSAVEGLEATAATPAGGEASTDSFSLDGLETTSMAAEPPHATTPEPLPDLELGGTGDLGLQAAESASAASAAPSHQDAPPAADGGALDLDLSSLGASPAPSSQAEQAIPADAPTEADSSSAGLEFDIPAPPATPSASAPPPEQEVAIDLSPAEPPASAAAASLSPTPEPPLEVLAPVVEEQQSESAPAPATATSAPDIDQGPSPFVTETMAELYLQQGHREEALSVYRALLAQRPTDTKLREKVDELSQPSPSAAKSSANATSGPSIRHVLRLVALRRPGFRPESLAVNGGEDGSSARQSVEAVPTPADVAAPVPLPGGSPGPDDALASRFGFAAPAHADQHAALALAMAFAHTGNGNASEASLLSGAPARAASSELSLDRVFGEQPPLPPAKSFSFDQFFSQRASAEHATLADSASAGDAVESAHDVAQFNQWLEGLKRR